MNRRWLLGPARLPRGSRDQDGEIAAAAHGRPPGWVDTSYGAELWAVQMVVTLVLPGSARVLVECEAVRNPLLSLSRGFLGRRKSRSSPVAFEISLNHRTSNIDIDTFLFQLIETLFFAA